MNYRLIIAILMFVAGVQSGVAQDFSMKKLKKEVKQALKDQKYSNAEKAISNAVKSHKEVLEDNDVVRMAVQTQYCLALAENRKIFLKNSPDTTKYFGYVYGMYDYALKSTDESKGAKRDLGQKLLQFNNNLKSAGKYFYKKGQHGEAVKCLEMYLGTMHHGLLTQFEEYELAADTTQLIELACYASYASKDYAKAAKYFRISTEVCRAVLENDGKSLVADYKNLYEVGIKSYMELKDSASACESLEEATKLYPEHRYFYISLLQYYLEKENYRAVEKLVGEELEIFPEDALLWFIKGQAEESMYKTNKALESLKHSLELDDTYIYTYAAIADIYLEKAQEEGAASSSGSMEQGAGSREQGIDYYKEAQGYYEKLRELAPERQDMWKQGLRECYFKLNDGRKLKEIEAL